MSCKEEEVADKMISQMIKWGLSPDDMIRVIRLARKKYHQMKNQPETSNQQPA